MESSSVTRKRNDRGDVNWEWQARQNSSWGTTTCGEGAFGTDSATKGKEWQAATSHRVRKGGREGGTRTSSAGGVVFGVGGPPFHGGSTPWSRAAAQAHSSVDKARTRKNRVTPLTAS